MSLPALAPAEAPAGPLAQGAAGGRGVLLRGQARRLSLPGVRGRRGGLPAVAQRQAARALLPRARASAAGATCSTGRSWCAARTAARTSTRSASASIRRPRGSSAWRSRRPPSTWPSTCSRARTSRCSSAPSQSAARRSRSCSRAMSSPAAPVELMAATTAAEDAREWLERAEGAIAKERAAPYRPGERKGMAKVKRVRTIDAVVVGWRPGKEPDTVGALILGLYDGSRAGRAARRRTLLRPHRRGEAPPGRLPRALPDRRARHGRSEPLERGQGPRVGRPAPRAGRGDRLRPRLGRAHPPRRQAAALARGQGPARVHVRSALRVSSAAGGSCRRRSGGGLGSCHEHRRARPSPRRSTCRSCSGCRRPACR